MTVIELRAFYGKPIGKMVLRLLKRQMSLIWPEIRAETLVSFGYGTSLMRPFSENGNKTLILMPGEQGALYWPSGEKNKVCLIHGAAWPLEDESVDRVVLVHALEVAADPEALLREVWRVLKGNGHLMAIVPNRRGMWAHSDKTPFGTGRPYSGGQIRRLLLGRGFSVNHETQSLFLLPFKNRFLLALSEIIEKIISSFWCSCGGLLIVEGVKQIYTPVMTKNRGRFKDALVYPASLSSSSHLSVYDKNHK